MGFMHSSVVRESLFIPCIFLIGVRFIDDQSMRSQREKKRKEKKKRNDMFVYGILLHWALMSTFEVYLLGIFVIVGTCEIFI